MMMMTMMMCLKLLGCRAERRRDRPTDGRTDREITYSEAAFNNSIANKRLSVMLSTYRELHGI